MMKRIGTKCLWSHYSFKGRKRKKSFQDILLSRVLIRACLKNNAKSKEQETEEAISETLKYAPYQHGGNQMQDLERKRTNSDS
ncbi:hypothetical protein ACJMK2_032122 [Sinanodonta woodiana]|uniref:Uncharacterized protein n=1 Tax=Sinanodonta woodiana TaxID=1069815 RepID=A0ABD3X2W0_SINWO